MGQDTHFGFPLCRAGEFPAHARLDQFLGRGRSLFGGDRSPKERHPVKEEPMQREDVVRALKNDLNVLVQTILEKYYRGRFPYGMDAASFRSFALGLIKRAVDERISDEEFLEKNLP